MLHLLLTLNALIVLIYLFTRMSNRDHIGDPLAILVWLGFCFYDTQLLFVTTVLATLTLAYYNIPAFNQAFRNTAQDAG